MILYISIYCPKSPLKGIAVNLRGELEIREIKKVSPPFEEGVALTFKARSGWLIHSILITLLTSVVLHKNLLLSLTEIPMVNIIEYRKMKSGINTFRVLDSL
jgi:hypothetical protein